MAAGTWVKLEQKGDGPGDRSSHAITLVGDTAYAFGGEFTPRVPVDNAMYAFDLTAQRWSPLAAAGDVPPPRVGVTMASVGATVYMFGGRDEQHRELDELYSFDTATAAWTLLYSGDGDGPPRRSYHSMVADAGAGVVYVFGGCGEGGRLNDMWAYDVAGGRWEALPSPGESCKPRGGPGLAVSGGGKVWVVYGFSGEELDDVHCYDPVTGAWSNAVETTGDKPSPRSVFCCVGIGRHVVVFGGEVDPSDLGHLGAGKFSGEAFALDTETGKWARLDGDAFASEQQQQQHPGPRGWCAFSAGELDGRRGMLVYGGNSPTNDRLGDIYFFTPPLASSS